MTDKQHGSLSKSAACLLTCWKSIDLTSTGMDMKHISSLNQGTILKIIDAEQGWLSQSSFLDRFPKTCFFEEDGLCHQLKNVQNSDVTEALKELLCAWESSFEDACREIGHHCTLKNDLKKEIKDIIVNLYDNGYHSKDLLPKLNDFFNTDFEVNFCSAPQTLYHYLHPSPPPKLHVRFPPVSDFLPFSFFFFYIFIHFEQQNLLVFFSRFLENQHLESETSLLFC